jgi:hypothetical protein
LQSVLQPTLRHPHQPPRYRPSTSIPRHPRHLGFFFATMKLPPIAVACLSALAIDSCSNVIAQRLKAWNESKPFVFDRVLFTQFAIMVLLTAPINYHWQNWLERAFPGWKTVKQTRAVGEGEEEKGIMLRGDGEEKGIVEEEVRVRNWWNIFRKWFTDVSNFSSTCGDGTRLTIYSVSPWARY